jgi:hypothetical protein
MQSNVVFTDHKFINTVHMYSVVSVVGTESKEDCHKELMQKLICWVCCICMKARKKMLIWVAEVHSLPNLLSYMNDSILKCILTVYHHKYALNLHKTL